MSGHTHYCYDFVDEKTRFISKAIGEDIGLHGNSPADYENYYHKIIQGYYFHNQK